MPHSIDNIDLDFLSDTERDLILEVLRRDEELRQTEEQRIRKLKAELLEIKRKGAKRGSRRYSQRSCARCHGSMSLLVFNSDHCQRCHHLVCSKCRASLPDGSWLCRVCIKESDLRKTTGDWFYNLRVNRFSTMPGHELVRSSLRKRPTAKKYVTMGDVLLKHSESTRGPPVPVPRQKVNTTNISENSGSIISTASSETKGDEFFHHGPSSEDSGSVASTVSYERKGIDSLFKSLQSDTESAEVASLTSGKTGTESGRVTPDLPRRAILPPHFNQSHGSSVTPPGVNDGLDVCEQPDSDEVPGEVKSQFVQGLDSQVPEKKQASPSPEFDVDELFKKSVKPIENPPEFDKYPLDVSEQADLHEVPMGIKRQRSRGLEAEVPEIKLASLNPGLDVENFSRMSVKHIEKPPECDKYGMDVSDQPDSYEVPVDRQFIQDFEMQVPEIKQACLNLGFGVENIYRMSLKHIESPPECVKYGLDICEQPDSYEVPVAAKRQFVHGLDMQVPEMKRASSSPELDGDKLFKKSVTNNENPPQSVKCGLDICDQPDAFEILRDVESQSVQSLDTQAPEKKPVSPSPELDVQTLFKKSVSRTQNPPEHLSTLDLRENQDMLTVPMGKRSQSVPELDMQDDEEEDIDSLVNFHRNSMVSSASSMSMTSIYSDSGDGYSMDVRGEVVFSMFYDESSQSLQVLIKECRKLACGDSLRQFSNPYVKCYLLPDKSRQSKRKTTIKRHTCNPVYEETFKYSIRRNQLLTRSMLISVWHHGHLTSNPFLGEVEIALDCFDLDSPQEECMALMTKAPCCVPTSAFTQLKGELVISLKYVTPKGPPLQKFKGKKVVEVKGGELHILIKEAKNLMAMKGGGMSDSFVKGYLFPSKSKTNKRKTPVVKKNLNPHYGHTFVYKELTLEQLSTMCLELTVWDREPMLSNEFLGGVRLSSGEGSVKIGNEEVGMDSVGEEVSLWQKMMQYPDSWAEGTLPLRTTMKKKGK
ncbi:synaptotagmin-like protein 4 isoform X3 [Syngnathus acus]|uniref:synaptotagmin-like protein 4 isoform X3 n=1 Tax=Syngnathus acus TaxID=161584 RepID=UPI0018864349|nr:synaptotagmin-like protein 4 isoform X3 [Syngnathus acus]